MGEGENDEDEESGKTHAKIIILWFKFRFHLNRIFPCCCKQPLLEEDDTDSEDEYGGAPKPNSLAPS